MNSNIPAAHLELADISVLPLVYEDMERQFPPDEMYQYNHIIQLLNHSLYKVLLFKRDTDNTPVGYALVYSAEKSNYLWLDYLAILKPYHSHGYGSQLFEAILQKYGGSYNGILFSVEHISENDTELAKRQQRRINFYNRLGAHQLKANFLLPCEDGDLPMYLFFKPSHGISSITRQDQIEVITQMYDYCYFHIKHRRQLFSISKPSIVDEFFPG